MTLKLDGTGAITGIDQGLNIVGVVTYSTDLNVGGDLNVTGVLTYDDVTNIDSIGVITARSGIHVTGGDVGIGTTTPNYKLEIDGDVGIRNNSESDLYFNVDYGNGTTSSAAIFSYPTRFGIKQGGNSRADNYIFYYNQDASTAANDYISLDCGDAERLRITGSGNVGIGTDNPESKLVVTGNSATARLELKRTNAAGGGSYGAINFTALDGHSVASIHAKGDGDGDDDGGDIVFRTTSAATTNDPYTADERLRIASAGQIGLGGANYGTNNQVITSTGTGSAPEWRGVNAAFYGKQDATHNVTHATWNTVKNFASDVVNTITGWSESTGIFTANADTAGTYYIFGSCGIDDVQTLDVMRVGICKNNETPAAFTEYRQYSGASNQITGGTMVARVVTLADGDNVRMKVYHNEGNTQPTEANRTFFGGFRLSV